MNMEMVRLMRNILEIQTGVDMKMWKYWERRYESECEDDDEERDRNGNKIN